MSDVYLFTDMADFWTSRFSESPLLGIGALASDFLDLTLCGFARRGGEPFIGHLRIVAHPGVRRLG
jgi:hypothetical protein